MTSAPDQRLLESAFASVGRSFYGEIWDYARTIELGAGYELPKWNLCRTCRAKGIKTCRHFEIDTARQLIGIFRALKDENVPLVMNSKAAQTLGSLVWDLWVQYLLACTDYNRIIIYLENDQKAKIYCDSRLMPTLKKNPDIAPFLPTGADRFDDTKTDIIFTNGKMIRVCGLNETNASSLTWQVVIIDESWQHGKDGLQQKAMDRNKQVANKKTYIVSQCGKVDEDLDAVWKRVRHVPVTWRCPCCDTSQTFNERGPSVERPADFVAKPATIHCDYAEAPKEPPKPGSWAGLQIEKSLDEIQTSQEISDAAATAFLECFHCGARMRDTKPLRDYLMQSYSQDYTLGKGYVEPGTEVGFWNPEVVSVTVPWSDTMKNYISAKKLQSALGNLTALSTFFQSRWAIPWDERLVEKLREQARIEYDIELAKHNAWRMWMICDCQQDLMLEWVQIWAVQKDGSARQIWRGPLMGLDKCREKQLEYGIDKRGNPILKDQWCFLDSRYKPDEIRRHIVMHRYGHWATINGVREWIGWNMMQGSKFEYFSHAVEKDRTKKFVVGDCVTHGYQLDGRWIELRTYPFSATSCGQRFEASRDGKGQETLFLPRQPGEPPDSEPLSHWSQIHSNKLRPSKQVNPRDSKMHYVPVPPTAADHHFHIGRMMEACREIFLVDGIIGAPKENAEVAK